MAKYRVDVTPGHGTQRSRGAHKVGTISIPTSSNVIRTCCVCHRGKNESQYDPKEITRYTSDPKNQPAPACLACFGKTKHNQYLAEWQARRKETLQQGFCAHGRVDRETGKVETDKREQDFLKRRYARRR